jgi:hypothetical protein
MRKLANVLVVVNNQYMKKSRLIFYLAVLVLLLFLYYSIGDIFYSIISADGLPLLMVVYVIAPLTLVLGFIRLWLLKPVNQRSRLLDFLYFIMPVMIIIACFAAWIWAGIILSVLAGALIGYEFIRSIIKMNTMLLRKKNRV